MGWTMVNGVGSGSVEIDDASHVEWMGAVPFESREVEQLFRKDSMQAFPSGTSRELIGAC